MGRSFAWKICTLFCSVFCTVFCSATASQARADCWSCPAPRSAYAVAVPQTYADGLDLLSAGRGPIGSAATDFLRPVHPQLVQQPVVQQPVLPPRVVYRPILPLAPVPETYYTGQGVLGQPKLYVPGQPIRNFLRYLGP